MSVVLGAVLAVGGCAEPQDGRASVSPDLCTGLLRDMRLYCRQDSRDGRAMLGGDCVSRRLEFEQRCQ